MVVVFGNPLEGSRMIFKEIRLQVRNGGRINFWHDALIGHTPLKFRYPDPFSCSADKDATVPKLNRGSNWHLNFRRHWSNWDIDTLGALLQKIEHECIGRWKRRIFLFVCFRYQKTFSLPCKIIGELSFVGYWLTQSTLHKRGVQLCSRCFFSEKEVETVLICFYIVK